MKKKLKEFQKMMNKPKVKTWSAIFDLNRAMIHFLDSELRKSDCSISKFHLLLLLYFEGNMTPVQLSRRLMVSRANTTTFLRRISKEGYIEKTIEGGSEKRPAFKLSKNGIDYFEGLFPGHIEDIETVFNYHSEEVTKKFQKIRESLE